MNLTDNNSKQKIMNIEFLRFFFAVTIVVYHLFTGWLPEYFKDIQLFSYIHQITRQADRAVDFFFIISGFFLLLTFKKDLSVIDFLKKKIVRLWPMAIFAVAAWTIIFALGFITPARYGTYDNIFGLFMINNIGITTNIGVNIQSWYVSSLILVLLTYFYFLKVFEQKYINIIIAVITLFCYSYLIHVQNGVLTGEFVTYNNIFNVGIMRAFGGCGIGYFICNYFLSKSKSQKYNVYLWSIVEIISVAFLFINMFLHRLNYSNDFIYILFFIILFVDFINRAGIFARILDSKFSNFLGKYSYALYMSHRVVFAVLSVTMWKNYFYVQNHSYIIIFASIFISILASIVLYHIFEKPVEKFLQNLLFEKKS